MSDLNQCTFTGRLGADPEVKSFQNGGRVCNLRLAVADRWKDKQTGERKERTEWVSVTIHSDGLVGIAQQYLRKGSRILIQGQLRTRKWQDQSGSDRYSTECVLSGFDAKLLMLDTRQGGEGQQSRQSASSEYDDLNDDIPF